MGRWDMGLFIVLSTTYLDPLDPGKMGWVGSLGRAGILIVLMASDLARKPIESDEICHSRP